MDTVFLQNYRLFRDLTESELHRLADVFVEKRISEGAAVYLENMPGEALYVISNGTVRISKMLSEGDEQILVVLGPGEYFGEMALLDGSTRAATARVLEQVDLLCLKKVDFERYCSDYPHAGIKLIKNIIKEFCLKIHDSNQELKDYFFRTLL